MHDLLKRMLDVAPFTDRDVSDEEIAEEMDPVSEGYEPKE